MMDNFDGKIQPCPYCDATMCYLGKDSEDIGWRHWVHCFQCGAESPRCKTKAEAVTRWNLVGAVVRGAKAVRAGYQHAIIALVDAVHALDAQDAPERRPFISGKDDVTAPSQPEPATVQCNRCAGTGVFRTPGMRGPCEKCNGSGKVPAPEPDPAEDPDLMTCPACRGDGFARGTRPGACAACQGTGQVPANTE